MASQMFWNFNKTIFSKKIHLLIIGIVTLILVTIPFFDNQSNECRLIIEKKIIYNQYLISEASNRFTSIWTLQFFKDQNLVLNSPNGSLYNVAKIEASTYKELQDQFINSLHDTSCNKWGYLKIISIIIAFVLQSMSIYLAIFKV